MVWKGFFALVEIYPCEMAPICYLLKVYSQPEGLIGMLAVWQLQSDGRAELDGPSHTDPGEL